MVLRLIITSYDFVACSLMNLAPLPTSHRYGGYLHTLHMRELVVLAVSMVGVVLICYWLRSPS